MTTESLRITKTYLDNLLPNSPEPNWK
uniref:Uncharacterized protein n=1 Tax=Rhizophora mucronata TaxID=61149 RepID=A0A2P2Q1I9_RHIMU